VKLRDISVLSGARASAIETSANISVGCWVRATSTFTLLLDNDKEEEDDAQEEEEENDKIKVPAGSLGTVLHIGEEPSEHAASINVDFEGIGGGHQTVSKQHYGKISVLSLDHMFVNESGKMSLLPEVALLQKRVQRKIMVELLVAPTKVAGALNVPNTERRTVLMYAAKHGLDSVVELLVAHGAKPELKDKDGSTALLLACGKGHTIAAQLLLVPTDAAGALDVRNETGCTALMLAVDKGLFSVVERLVSAGAKVEVTDKDGMTALALACVKLRDISVLSGVEATWAETSANISVGCWVKATRQWKSGEIKVPEDTLGTVLCISAKLSKDNYVISSEGIEKMSEDTYVISIDFEGIHDQVLIHSRIFSRISVLSQDHVFVSESGQMSLVSDEALLEKKAQREKVVKMMVAPTQAAGALDV